MAWTSTQKKAIQRQLKRLGLYTGAIDGLIGPLSEIGLMEAFGSEAWRTLSGATCLARLTPLSPPRGTKGEHRLRWAELFRGGVLDVTLGVGFDEGNSHLPLLSELRAGLLARGLRLDPGRTRAAQLYAAASRSLPADAFGEFYVRDRAISFTPPAGSPIDVHLVVRLLCSSDGTAGGRAAAAFTDGLLNSDIAYYSGHARYGSGPDFDRNMSFELLDTNGALERIIADYDDLEVFLASEGSPSGRSAWEQFLHRVDAHRIRVIGYNAGNLFINPTNRHTGEFGGKLMYWNLARSGSQGAPVVTGTNGALASRPETRGYNLWVFDGCRTQDYTSSIRATPRLDARRTDLMVTRRVLYWSDNGRTFTAFLDGILGLGTAEQIMRAMDAQNLTGSDGGTPAMRGDGFTENPFIP
jgi:hypothetical protein